MLSLCALMGTENICYAADETTKTQYLENHYQVNFTDLNVYVIDDSELILEPKETVSVWSRREVSNEIAMLEESMNDNPDIVEVIIEELNSGEELMAISVSEAPIVWAEDHYERVLSSNARSYESGDESLKGKFTLFTTVTRSYNKNTNGTYNYTTNTYGDWTAHSVLGGSNYPASGEDYVLQSTPNNWTRKSRSMSAYYDDETDGTQGEEFWFCAGGANYIEAAIMDDPFGWRQNEKFSLSCVSAGNATSNYRVINSYYVHTWVDLEITVSVQASTEKK